MKTHLKETLGFITGVVSLMTLLAFTQVAAAQTSDPVAVIKARDAAMAAGDLETALSFYADGATIRTADPDPGTTGVIEGKDQIRELLVSRIAVHIRFESMNFQVNGDTVTFEHRVWHDDPDLERLNLLPIETNNTVVVRDGKIHDWLIDIKDEWIARAEAAFAAEMGAPAGMPRTGGADSGFPVSAWLLVVSVLFGLCGLALRLAVSARREL
jgi:ketosteroid isomerase-like protein